MERNQVKVFVGFDTRRPNDFAATAKSILNHSPHAQIFPLLLPLLRVMGDYNRHTLMHEGVLYDTISEAPMSTEFAISRFLVPYLCGYKGKAIFVDGDFLFRADIAETLKFIADDAAIAVVKHEHVVRDGSIKMDGQPQVNYFRKNWSSLMVFNCEHESHVVALSHRRVNLLPGRDLHSLDWLSDNEISAIPEEWNWLEGYSKPMFSPKAVHYTRGTPDVIGYDISFAEEWRTIQESLGQ